MGMIIKRAVRVKAIVTEQFKARGIAALRAALAKIESDDKGISARIDVLRKAENAGPDQGRQLERLGVALRRNEKAKAAAVAELEKTSDLEIGSEYDRGILEGFVEVNVGDDFVRLADCEIVVLDDIVVEIRDGQCPEPKRM
jgi:hypothetical protein